MDYAGYEEKTEEDCYVKECAFYSGISSNGNNWN